MNSENNSELRSQKSEVGTQAKDRQTLLRGERPVLFYITGNGRILAEKISCLYPQSEVLKYSPGLFAERWSASKALICIMASGIVVRAVAPLLIDKRTDPAVVVLDERGHYAVSLLSGHIGGANELAREIAGHIGAHAVITTASDVQGKAALDLWAMEHDLYVEDHRKLKELSARIVNGGKVKLMAECPVDRENLPGELVLTESPEEADIIISERAGEEKALFLRPRNLFVGIGCNRGTSGKEIEDVFAGIFNEQGLSPFSVRSIATIDVKKDEQGLLDFSSERRLSLEFFSSDELNAAAIVHKIKASEAVRTATGAVAVAEPAALISAGKAFNDIALVQSKKKRGNVTLAIAKAEFML